MARACCHLKLQSSVRILLWRLLLYVPLSRELHAERAAKDEATAHKLQLQQQLTAVQAEQQATRQQLVAAQCERAHQEQKVGAGDPLFRQRVCTAACNKTWTSYSN